MSFFGNLGIDFKLLIAQIINFGLLLWLLNKFLYQPIIKRIEKDEAGLKQAQEQRKELEQEKNILARQKEEELSRVKTQAQEIIKEAERIAEEIKQQAHQEAEQEKQAIIKQIKDRLSEVENAEKSEEPK